MGRRHVQIGQVYQSVGAPTGRAWRVKSTLDLLGIPHARIVSVEDEGDIKTLSCLVLTDQSFYRLIEQAPS